MFGRRLVTGRCVPVRDPSVVRRRARLTACLTFRAPTRRPPCGWRCGWVNGLVMAEEDRRLGGDHLSVMTATQRADMPLGPRAADRPVASGTQPLDEWRPSAAGRLSTSRLNALLSGDDGEEMSSQETGSTDAPTGPPRNVPLTLNTVGSMVTTVDGLPQPPGPTAPLLAAARRAPGPGLSVQHNSLDSGRRPLSSDDGEPLLLPPPPPRPPPHTPLQLQPGAPRPALPEAPFEWVTRGVPPLPPKKTSLCAPRFEWVRAATPPPAPPAPPTPPAPPAPCPAVRRSSHPRAAAGAWAARVQLDAAPQPGRRTAAR